MNQTEDSDFFFIFFCAKKKSYIYECTAQKDWVWANREIETRSTRIWKECPSRRRVAHDDPMIGITFVISRQWCCLVFSFDGTTRMERVCTNVHSCTKETAPEISFLYPFFIELILYILSLYFFKKQPYHLSFLYNLFLNPSTVRRHMAAILCVKPCELCGRCLSASKYLFSILNLESWFCLGNSAITRDLCLSCGNTFGIQD